MQIVLFVYSVAILTLVDEDILVASFMEYVSAFFYSST